MPRHERRRVLARQQLRDRYDQRRVADHAQAAVDTASQLRERAQPVLARAPSPCRASPGAPSACRRAARMPARDVVDAHARVPDVEVAHRRRSSRIAFAVRAGGGASTPRAARRRSKPAVAPGDREARAEPLDVPLPRPGQRLVEVVEVEDELAVGARRSRRSWRGARRRRAARAKPERGVAARSAAMIAAAPRKNANGDGDMRPYRIGSSSGTRVSAWLSRIPTGSARSAGGLQSA